ncbi:MAG TPA: hypothetical protein VGF14_08050 [Alphaproteobacteria bacterium]
MNTDQITAYKERVEGKFPPGEGVIGQSGKWHPVVNVMKFNDNFSAEPPTDNSQPQGPAL